MAKITLESVCKDIVLAQICSDSGKDIYLLPEALQKKDLSSKAIKYAYEDKSFYLLRAIQQIENSPYLGVRYYVAKDKEYGGCIVYFQVAVPGRKHTIQVSFHTPGWDANLKKIKKFEGKTCPIRWDKKSSRNTCYIIIKYFKW